MCATRVKKGKTFENFEQKYTKKRGSLMRATITCMKQLEYALEMQLNLKDNLPCKFST